MRAYILALSLALTGPVCAAELSDPELAAVTGERILIVFDDGPMEYQAAMQRMADTFNAIEDQTGINPFLYDLTLHVSGMRYAPGVVPVTVEDTGAIVLRFPYVERMTVEWLPGMDVIEFVGLDLSGTVVTITTH